MCTVNVTCRGVQTSLSLSQVVGFNGCSVTNSPTGQIVYETISNISQGSVEQTMSRSGPQNYDTIEAQISPPMVVEFGQPSQGLVLAESSSQDSNDNGCITKSMGCTLQWQESSGPLDLTTGQDAYQCSGALGSMGGSEGFSPFPSPYRSIDSDGKHSSPI